MTSRILSPLRGWLPGAIAFPGLTPRGYILSPLRGYAAGPYRRRIATGH